MGRAIIHKTAPNSNLGSSPKWRSLYRLPRKQTAGRADKKPKTRAQLVVWYISQGTRIQRSLLLKKGGPGGRISKEVSDSSDEFWWWIFIRNETLQIFTYLIQKCL